MNIEKMQALLREKMASKVQEQSTGKTVAFDGKLEALIDVALEDGVLTDKERALLLRKAQEAGIDIDEFEMVLDARLSKMKKKETAKAHAASENASIHRLFKMLDELSLDKKSFTDVISGTLKSRIADDDDEDDYQDRLEQKKRELIETFPLPTQKEDIIEFLTQALPLAKKRGKVRNALSNVPFVNIFVDEDTENESHNFMASAWRAKCEQIINKARFTMKDDPETYNEIMLCAKELGIKI